MATKMLNDDEKANPSPKKESKKRLPRVNTRIHVPGHKNAFTYTVRTGMRKVDGSLERFCLEHKCLGVFEAKVALREFGLQTKQINQVKYDVKGDGIWLSYKSTRNGFDNLFIPFPCNITVRIPKNPEALYVESAGILSCRIPIVDHDLVIYQFDARKQPDVGAVGMKKQRKASEKMDKRLHRNHQRLSQAFIKEALNDDLEQQKLTQFQKSLYGIETKKVRKKPFY